MDTASLSLQLYLVEARHARQLVGHVARNGALRFEPVATLEDDWEAKQHGRPSALGMAGGRGRRAGYTFPGRGHEEEERERRFAGSLWRWIGAASASWGEGRVLLFATPRMLGVLRQQAPEALGRRVELHEGDLLGIAPVELAEHPRVRAAIGAQEA